MGDYKDFVERSERLGPTAPTRKSCAACGRPFEANEGTFGGLLCYDAKQCNESKEKGKQKQ